MNLPVFLHQVDAATARMSREQLAELIHKMAVATPESERSRFLKRLSAIDAEGVIQEKPSFDKEDYESLLEQLQAIHAGELRLIGNLNEEYDDWYGDGDEFLFEDPDHLCGVLERAAARVHLCTDRTLYAEGYALARLLLELEVAVDGDYCDYYGDDMLSIEDLYDNDLVSMDFDRFRKEALYNAYSSHRLEERTELLYSLFQMRIFQSLSFRDLHAVGDLEQEEEFLPLWIDYLGRQTSRDAERLMTEAVASAEDRGVTLSAARRFYAAHPGLYVDYLEAAKAAEAYEELSIVGAEAVEKIAPKYLIRSRAALLAAEGALHQDQRQQAERLWMEAFRSDTIPVHYLRLAAECTDFSQYRAQAEQIFKTTAAAQYDASSPGRPYALQTNTMDTCDKMTLSFLNGDFSRVMEEGMSVTKDLGWSSTFMKQGLRLFLLHLYNGTELPAGCRVLCSNAAAEIEFTAEEYDRGLLTSRPRDNCTAFWESFYKWKGSTPIEEPERLSILHRIEALLQRRVKAIMESNRRNYYAECAAFIAAVGEVRESWGEKGAKQQFMWTYKLAYSRRTAFHKELMALGMRKQ